MGLLLTSDYRLGHGERYAVENDTALTVYSSGGLAPVRIILDGLLLSEQTASTGAWSLGIRYNGGSPSAGQLGNITIGPSGILRAVADYSRQLSGDARGIYAEGFVDFVNNGLVEVIARASALGVFTQRTESRIANNGVVRVQGDTASAFTFTYGSTFTNTGLVEVYGTQSATGVFNGDGFRAVTFSNTGVIRAVVSSPSGTSTGLSSVGASAIENAGTIQGAVSIQVHAGSYGGPIPITPILNSGQLIGHADLTRGQVNFTNSGTVSGDVRMGQYVDVYDGRLGRVSGLIDGGGGSDRLFGGATGDRMTGGTGDDTVEGDAGDDTLDGGAGANSLRGGDGHDSIVGGSGFDDINGNMGNDTAGGAGGNDWVVGGKDSDLLFGDAGDDLVYGNLGNDTCEGGDGNDIVRGGQGDDVVRGGAGADFVSGDLGSDTLSGGAGADTFNTFAETGLDRVLDFNAAEGDRVQLAPGTQYTVAQVGADTVIGMTGGGQMVLVGVQMSALTAGWIFGA